MIHGLYHQRAEKVLRARAKRLLATDLTALPAERHAAETDADSLVRELARISGEIADVETWLSDLAPLIRKLRIRNIGYRNATLALQHLEDAESRLIRELGDKPAH